jgi:hypothetical protein
MYGGSDPAFFRISRAEKGTAVVKSVPLNVDRVSA